jgi:hypothetical protein
MRCGDKLAKRVAIVTSKFVFVHVPRTGGTSARAAILASFPDARDSNGSRANFACRKDACGVGIPPEQHIAASKLERRDDTMRMRPMIGFVRHPVTWYASMWSWATKTGFAAKIARDPFAKRHWLAAVWGDGLEEFLDNVIALQVPRAWVVFHEKLSRADGSMCDFGRYEALHGDMLRLTGCSIVSRLRQSHEKSKLQKIDILRRDAIEWLERETIKKFYGGAGA